MTSTTKKTSNAKIKSNVKAGGLTTQNHNATRAKVKSGVKAGFVMRVNSASPML